MIPSVVCIGPKETQWIEVTGLQALGGKMASGLRLPSLKQPDDYVVMSSSQGVLSLHLLKGKKAGLITLKPFERVEVQDLTLIALPPQIHADRDQGNSSLWMKNLGQLLQFVGGELDLKVALDEILKTMVGAFELEKGFIVAKSIRNSFDIVSYANIDPTDSWLSESLLNETLSGNQSIVVQNIIGTKFETNKSLVATGFLSVLTWPLRLRGETLGALVLGSTRPHSGLTDEQKSLAEVVSQIAAYVLSSHLKDLKLREQAQTLRKLREGGQGPFITQDSRLDSINQMAQKIAPTDLAVLVCGETGVGKEVLARWIHGSSRSSQGEFVAVNCGAIPENLIESVLFGHKKGSFTGAHADQIGKFQQAHGGTLFLDEIGDLPAHLQVKLLRALQEKVIEPIGARAPIPVQVRVISATHKNLADQVKAGRFREDLFYRLAEVTLEIPPLRERSEDIGILASWYLKENFSTKRLSAQAWDWIRGQQWPGNVRELLSSLKRASIMSTGDEIQREDFLAGTMARSESQGTGNWLGASNLDEALKGFLQSKVQKALELSGGNRKQAADLLGVTPRTLFRYLEEMRSEMTDLSV